MKKVLLIASFSMLFLNTVCSQTKKAWSGVKSENFELAKTVQRESFPIDYKLMELDLNVLKSALSNAPDRAFTNRSSVIISLPNANGELEQFQMYEASNFDSELQAQFPDIRSYVGVGLDDKYARVRLSIDAKTINTMITRADKPTEFMEPYSSDLKKYAVYTSLRVKGKLPFTCSTIEQVVTEDLTYQADNFSKSNTGSLKTFRLAMSVTPEYTAYHHAALGLATPKTSALSAINTTMTRVNGVFENDFAVHMNLINNTTIIYDGSVPDPYGSTSTNYNSQLQSTLNSVVGSANYDVGHLMGNVGNNGNAGCIGCVCGTNKGSGFTTSVTPVGDTFDIDYVAHEMGHQFGANHTFSHGNEGSGVNVEVGSGVTIMGYAGITPYDTHSNSIDVFHSASIAQVQSNLVTKFCPTSTPITHGAPVVDAGQNYIIPKSTPFVLTGSATDAGGSNTLTYTWEQFDNASSAQGGAASAASATKQSGPNWVNYVDSSSPTRYFPLLSSVLNNLTTTNGLEVTAEALSSVSRILNFRLTARDNVIGQGQTGFDNMTVTVDATKGPLTVTSQNTDNISYDVNSTQTVTWNVLNTNSIAGGNNVDILITTDGGQTWTTLLANTPNDGSESIVMPSSPAPVCRLMVKASNNIFFNVNSKNFAIGYTSSCNTYSNNTVLSVPDGAGANVSGAVASKTISVSGATGTISDVNVTLGISHTYIEDLVVALNHPDGTQVILWNRNCDNNPTSLTYTFDAGNPTVPSSNCSATTGTFGPFGDLNSFNGKAADGTWTLLAVDYYSGDTGVINDWTLSICTQTSLKSNGYEISDLNLYPNPNNGNFTLEFNAESSNVVVNVHDVRGRQIMSKSFNSNGIFNENIQLDNVESGVYLVTILDGSRQSVKKIIIE
ncbi:reprolysin-like metallopeptidase [Flavobacterium chuncheonense]|uniref:Reprolysin-like metallopeptidase n=1 Tax=Flavobacterium chuncheonense TaxID=2026653 RepID=A0ABW5YM45_9FLAO